MYSFFSKVLTAIKKFFLSFKITITYEKKPWEPETFGEAVRFVVQILTDPDNEEIFRKFLEMDKEQFITGLHHSLGRTIRNKLRLWEIDSPVHKAMAQEFKLFHADDMSGLIFEAAYCMIKEKDFNPLPSVTKYLEYRVEVEKQKIRESKGYQSQYANDAGIGDMGK